MKISFTRNYQLPKEDIFSIPLFILHPDIQALIQKRITNLDISEEYEVIISQNALYFFIYLQSLKRDTWHRLNIELT